MHTYACVCVCVRAISLSLQLKSSSFRPIVLASILLSPNAYCVCRLSEFMFHAGNVAVHVRVCMFMILWQHFRFRYAILYYICNYPCNYNSLPPSGLPTIIRFKLYTTSTSLTSLHMHKTLYVFVCICLGVCLCMCMCMRVCVCVLAALWHRSYAPLASQVPLLWRLLLRKAFWHASRYQDFKTLAIWQPNKATKLILMLFVCATD